MRNILRFQQTPNDTVLRGTILGMTETFVQFWRIFGIVTDDTVAHVERILTTGAPAGFHGESSVKKFLDYWRYGNHVSVNSNKAKIEIVMNKEDKHQYLLPLPC